MKKKHRLIAILTALSMGIASVIPMGVNGIVSMASTTYEKDKVYDATETHMKLQPSSYSYNGYKVVPFITCDTYLSDIDVGTEYAFGSAKEVVEGDKVVIEFQTPIDSSKFEFITIAMKQVPGNYYNAYNVSDDILSTVRKSFSFGSYDVEKFSFQTSLFADDNGLVSAIILENTKSEVAGQLFVDEFVVTDSPYGMNGECDADNGPGGGNGSTGSLGQDADSKNQYDATKNHLVVQTSENYNGLSIVPFEGYGTELSSLGVGEGYAIYTLENIKKNDVVVIEFVTPVDSKKVDLITLSMKQTAGYSYSVYKGTDTALTTPIKTVDFGSYDIEKTAFRTTLFADNNGKVKSLIFKCEKAGESGQMFVDGYSLGNDPYQLGITYDVDENYVKLQNAGSYKGLTVAPFGERTTFWSKEAKVDSDEGYGLVAHRADNTELQKGDVMILEFVTDIAVNKYEVLNLTLATATEKGAIFEVYSVNEIQNGKLGEAKQRITADFWSFRTNNIALESLADENGYVGAIALKLISDEAPTFTVGSFSLGTLDSLIEKGAPQILDNRITAFETEDAYEFTIEFNSTGAFSGNYNEKTVGELVSLNGVKLVDINKESTSVKLSMALMGRYCMTIAVDKDYKGEGSVINTDKHLVGNCVQIEKGFTLPNGEKLADTYAMHVYLVDSITDVVDDTQEYAAIGINSLNSYVDENGNLIINVHFNNEIAGNPLYYLCNPDSFNRKEVAKLNGEAVLYDANIAKAFIYGGYKSSLLDNMKINGNTIGEWLAMDELAGSLGYNSAIMVHYGQMGNKVATIMISATSEISKELNKSYEAGTLEVTLNEGLRFPSGRGVEDSVTYRYSDSVWNKVSSAEFAVYYDGQKVEDGDSLTVNKVVSVNNITILGDGDYQIEENITENKVEYTIFNGEERMLQFTVEGTMVIPVSDSSNQSLIIGVIVAVVVLLGAGSTVFLLRRRKKHAEENAN